MFKIQEIGDYGTSKKKKKENVNEELGNSNPMSKTFHDKIPNPQVPSFLSVFKSEGPDLFIFWFFKAFLIGSLNLVIWFGLLAVIF